MECSLSNNHVDQTILLIHKFIHIERIKETHVLVVTTSTYYISLCEWRVVRYLTSITLSDYAFLLSNLLLQQNIRAHNTNIQDHNVNYSSNMGQDMLNWYSTANSSTQRGQNNTILRRVLSDQSNLNKTKNKKQQPPIIYTNHWISKICSWMKWLP